MAARGQYAKGVAKREEILSTALDVIARNGYRRTSVKELAEAVGLSQAGLLHYFSSKEELFQEILRKRDEVDSQNFVLGDRNPFDVFIDVIAHNAEVPGLVQLYAQLSTEAGDPDHPARQYFIDRFQAFRDTLAPTITAEQAAGRMRSDIDPIVVTNIMLAVSDGMQTQWMLDPTVDMAGTLAALLDVLRPVDAPERQD
ncbi:MAG: helix-turn-helix domain-containing protein [Leifsonia sp.]